MTWSQYFGDCVCFGSRRRRSDDGYEAIGAGGPDEEEFDALEAPPKARKILGFRHPTISVRSTMPALCLRRASFGERRCLVDDCGRADTAQSKAAHLLGMSGPPPRQTTQPKRRADMALDSDAYDTSDDDEPPKRVVGTAGSASHASSS